MTREYTDEQLEMLVKIAAREQINQCVHALAPSHDYFLRHKVNDAASPDVKAVLHEWRTLHWIDE